MLSFTRHVALVLLPFFACASSFAIDSKGAIIIANIVGKVEVVNNTTQVPLAPDKVKAGGILFDGHTVKASRRLKQFYSCPAVQSLPCEKTLPLT